MFKRLPFKSLNEIYGNKFNVRCFTFHISYFFLFHRSMRPAVQETQCCVKDICSLNTICHQHKDKDQFDKIKCEKLFCGAHH